MADELNDITLEKDKNQVGKIKVHTEIINTLSSGIYSSPANCIKELVNNSFDADASLVTIRIKPIHDKITLIDDGEGMNAIDFNQNFAWISKSNKRNNSEFTPSGRPLIGKIGIGFIAVNEICDGLEIISSKKGEDLKFTARINFKDYLEKDTQDNDGIIKANFDLINEDEDKEEHYTIINLLGLKDTVKDILMDQQFCSKISEKENKEFRKNAFKNMRELIEHHYNKKLKTIEKDNAYIQFIIDLSAYIPVEYIAGGPIEGENIPTIREIVDMHKNFKFNVDLDGIYLKKPIFFPIKNPVRKNNKFIVKSFKEDLDVSNDKKLSFKGYFYAWNELLVPREFNGIAIRIKNIPIAERFGFDYTLLGYPAYTDQIFRNWVMGEIYLSQGLEEAMNIDRKSFRKTHPEYLALQDWVHRFLREEVFARQIQDLYDKSRNKREKEKESRKEVIQRKILGTEEIVLETKQLVTKSQDAEVKKSKVQTKVEQNIPLKISKERDKAVITIDQSLKKKYKTEDWRIIENVFIIFEIAYNECKGDAKKLRDIFYSKMKALSEIKRTKK